MHVEMTPLFSAGNGAKTQNHCHFSQMCPSQLSVITETKQSYGKLGESKTQLRRLLRSIQRDTRNPMKNLNF